MLTAPLRLASDLPFSRSSAEFETTTTMFGHVIFFRLGCIVSLLWCCVDTQIKVVANENWSKLSAAKRGYIAMSDGYVL